MSSLRSAILNTVQSTHSASSSVQPRTIIQVLINASSHTDTTTSAFNGDHSMTYLSITPDASDNVDILNTPLNAPEPSLTPYTGSPGILLGSTGSSDLAWIIPAVLAVVAGMVGLAFAFYFCVRFMEMRMLGWCFRNCSCCCKPNSKGRKLVAGKSYNPFEDEEDDESIGVRLKG